MGRSASPKVSNTLATVPCPCGRMFTKLGYTKHKCDEKPKTYPCDFCKTDFTTEKRLVNHLCEQKRRHLQKDDPAVRRGFMAYDRFNQKVMRKKKPTTQDEFSKSQFYGAFVRFGKHVIDINVLNLTGFIDFLLRVEAPIDKWISPVLYATYVRELNKTEPPVDALERVFKVMQQWAVESGEDWTDFFRKVEPPRAALWISNGKISPWVLFTASSAHDLLERMPPEQMAMVDKSIDSEFWRLKIERNQQDVDIIRSMLAEYGI